MIKYVKWGSILALSVGLSACDQDSASSTTDNAMDKARDAVEEVTEDSSSAIQGAMDTATDATSDVIEDVKKMGGDALQEAQDMAVNAAKDAANTRLESAVGSDTMDTIKSARDALDGSADALPGSTEELEEKLPKLPR